MRSLKEIIENAVGGGIRGLHDDLHNDLLAHGMISVDDNERRDGYIAKRNEPSWWDIHHVLEKHGYEHKHTNNVDDKLTYFTYHNPVLNTKINLDCWDGSINFLHIRHPE